MTIVKVVERQCGVVTLDTCDRHKVVVVAGDLRDSQLVDGPFEEPAPFDVTADRELFHFPLQRVARLHIAFSLPDAVHVVVQGGPVVDDRPVLADSAFHRTHRIEVARRPDDPGKAHGLLVPVQAIEQMELFLFSARFLVRELKHAGVAPVLVGGDEGFDRQLRRVPGDGDLDEVVVAIKSQSGGRVLFCSDHIRQHRTGPEPGKECRIPVATEEDRGHHHHSDQH